MYDILIQEMKCHGIIFAEGLSNDEIIKTEQRFNISFPQEMKNFYRKALPVSKGFYNWRDDSADNINSIEMAMKAPILGIIENIDDLEWCEKWGEEPNDIRDKEQVIVNLISKAPKLIPVYSHRYMASVECKENPVFSVWGTDVIYYGKNLLDYLMIEFKIKKGGVLMDNAVSYIPFWSDML